MEDAQTGNTSPHKKMFYGWVIVASGFILLFCFAGSGFYSFGVFIKPLESEFGWSRSAIALTISIYLLVNGLISPFIGRLIQTIGPRKVMCFAAFGTGACFFTISFTRHLLFLYAFYGLLAVNLVGMGFIPVSTIIARWFERRRGTAMGLAYMGLSAGGLALAPLIGWLTMAFGWRSAFIFLAFLVWVVALPLSRFVIREDPYESGLLPDGDLPERSEATTSPATDSNETQHRPETSVPLKEAFVSKAFWGIFVTFFLGAMAQMAVLQHQVALMYEKGIPYGLAATALGITSGIGGLGKFCFGRMTESFPLRWIVMICYVLQGIGIILLLHLNSVTIVWIYAVVFGFGMGGVVVLQPLAVGRFFGLTSFSVLLGTISLGQACGASIGAFSAGLIYDHFGDYHHALITFLVIYALAIASIFIAGRPKQI